MARRRDPDPTDAADRVPGVQWSDIRPARCSLEATLNHPLHTGRRSAGLALLLLLAGLAHGAPAAVDAFHSHRWTVADGLPSNSLGDIARADDGYLWIASDQGLIRFDGHGFTTFDGAVIPGLASNVITTVTIGRDGTLWAGTKHSGVIRGRDGRFQVISTGEDFASRDVLQIVEDRRGTVWVLTQRGVSTVEGDTVRAVPGLASEGGRAAIASDPRDDSLWFARGDGGELRRWHDGEVTTVDLGRRISTNARWLAPTSGGTSLVAAYSGMFRVDADLVATPLDLPGLEDRGTPFCQFAAESADGRRWFATGSGLVVVEAGAQRFIATGAAVTDLAFDTAGAAWFTAGPGVYRDDHLLLDCGSTVQGFLLDDEGGAWISTEFSGLLHLRPSVFRMQKRGESIYAVRESSSGSMWVGSWRVGVSELAGRTEPIEPFILVYSMLEWPAGTLWIGTQQGVARVVGDQWTPDPDSGRYRVATALELDDAGNVWIASEDALLRHDGTTVTRFPYDGTDLPPYAVTEIARGTDGEMWFGTAGGGVVRFRDGAFETLGTADGLPTGLIRALCVDSRGVVWAGTLGRGLVRIVPAKDQPLSASRITTIDQAGGLAQDEIDAIVEDGFQRLWLGGKRGIFRVDLAQLDAFADGAVDAVTCTSYSEADGLSHPAVNGVGHPSARRGADGRLWFCTQDGLAVVDPATLPTRPAPRPVVIERALSGREAVPVADDRIALGAGRRDLEIAFTSPDLSDPDNLRFRYRLRGLQKEWTETGARRSAYFTHLPPGRFTLELAVTRAGRPFGDQATAIELDVAPFYYETTWFRGGLAVLAAALLVLWLARRHRLHEEREQALRDLVAARTDELVREKALVERQSQQLEELNEAKSRFFANVSHEFRTPLTLTIGPLEDVIAGRAGQLPPDLEGTLQLALRNARRLLDLVNQILDIARLESGRLTVHPGHGDLAAFAREVAEGFAGWAERHEVALRLELPAEPTPFVFDPYVVERVLVNLLANAFKFTPRGGAVTLVLETDAEHARLVVRDTGPGIPTEERARIFSRFYRSSAEGTSPDTGTGIGLSLAHDLVAVHGGTITVGEAPGGGAAFTVTLPRGLEAEDGLDTGPYRQPASRIEPILPAASDRPADLADDGAGDDAELPVVLVVDDNAEIRAHVRRHLEPRYRVREAADGDQAWALAREIVPDLVVSDVMMPGRDGFALCADLKADPETDFVPVIMLTARGGVENRIAGLGHGADDYLSKPFSAEELLARVENLIVSRRRLRERFARGGAPTAAVTPPSDDPLVARFLAHVAQEMHDEDLSVQRVADHLRVDRSHLYRRIRETLDETPTDVVRHVRLARAAELLAHGSDGVGEIAYAVGFKSVSHFCRSFRKRYGETPAAYREARTGS